MKRKKRTFAINVDPLPIYVDGYILTGSEFDCPIGVYKKLAIHTHLNRGYNNRWIIVELSSGKYLYSTSTLKRIKDNYCGMWELINKHAAKEREKETSNPATRKFDIGYNRQVMFDVYGHQFESTTIREIAEKRQDLTLIDLSQDVQELKESEGKEKEWSDFDGLFSKATNGEVVEIWGFEGNPPYIDKIATRLK